MSQPICLRCRASIGVTLRAHHLYPPASIRTYSSSTQPTEAFPNAAATAQSSLRSKSSRPPKKPKLDIASLLSKPTWSVRTLAPPPSPTSEITPTQLSHLLRLSALPQPSSPEHEAKLLDTLHAQLHFVRDVQSVDTTGVDPMYCVRDETAAGEKECTIGLEDVRGALAQEEIRGRGRRPRRRRGGEADANADGKADWDVFAAAGEVMRRGEDKFFVVRSGKE